VTLIKVVGFDPSTTSWGTVVARVDIETLEITIDNLILTKTEPELKKGVRKDSDDLRRAGELRGAMLLASTGAALAISEIPFLNASPMAHASSNYNSGMMVGLLAGLNVPLIQVYPLDVKQAVTGSRNGAKEEIIEWATENWPAAPWLTHMKKGKVILNKDNEHLADAVASLFTGIRTDQFKQATAIMRSMMAA
jgi:Holliday junction resolvasome RuvABC endonuclease subunit